MPMQDNEKTGAFFLNQFPLSVEGITTISIEPSRDHNSHMDPDGETIPARQANASA